MWRPAGRYQHRTGMGAMRSARAGRRAQTGPSSGVVESAKERPQVRQRYQW